ncbi:MAG: VanZ family protein [Marinirhabdus sp.]|nr:VanZ family protein [Marinirhabdus sp.]
MISLAFLLPGKDLPPTDLPLDKVVHVFLHAGLLFLWLSYVNTIQTLTSIRKKAIFSFAACLAYGIVIEVLQENFVPLRYADVWDIAANGTGLILGGLVFFKTQKYFGNQN